MFYLPLIADLCNYTDDNTLYTCDSSLYALTIEWFRNNYMKLNESKCHLLIGWNKHEVVVANFGNATIIETHEAKLLGVNLDRELKFKKHMYLK